jgi:hypothetical protein
MRSAGTTEESESQSGWKYVDILNINEYHPRIIPFHQEKLPEKFLEPARKSHKI